MEIYLAHSATRQGECEDMSCRNCDEKQDEPMSAYYRWKNANIEMRGCDKHLREVFDALSEAQKQSNLP